MRLLTEGTDVTLAFVNDGAPGTVTLTAKRARYLDDNGTLSAAFLPGELSQSLCSPWTHDFRDCGCFYWASNHPDIAQPVMPAGTSPGQPWNAAVAWERRDRTINSTPPAKATEAAPGRSNCAITRSTIAGKNCILSSDAGRSPYHFPRRRFRACRLPDRAELLANLNYAAGVELAVAQEYLAAAYSLKPESSLAANSDFTWRRKAARAEFMRVAIGEMRHTRAVNDVIRGISDPAPSNRHCGSQARYRIRTPARSGR